MHAGNMAYGSQRLVGGENRRVLMEGVDDPELLQEPQQLFFAERHEIPDLPKSWCRWSGSNRHSLREHDFESCASANSATPASGALIAALGSHANGRFRRLRERDRLARMKTQFCLFDTSLGPCGLVWGEHG